MSSAGGHPSRQKMVSVGTSIVPPGPRPSPADTPGLSTAATAPQVTASLHDFAVSLSQGRLARAINTAGQPITAGLNSLKFTFPNEPWFSGHEAFRCLQQPHSGGKY